MCIAFLVEHQLVTDRQTDTHTQGYGIHRASIASRGNKTSATIIDADIIFSFCFNTIIEFY